MLLLMDVLSVSTKNTALSNKVKTGRLSYILPVFFLLFLKNCKKSAFGLLPSYSEKSTKERILRLISFYAATSKVCENIPYIIQCLGSGR